MDERTPLLLASASIIGIMLISFVSEQISLGFTELKDIDMHKINEDVHVRGLVAEAKKFSAGYKMLLEQDGFKTSVVYFTRDDVLVKKGMCADVIGEVKTNEGAMEIEAKTSQVFMC